MTAKQNQKRFFILFFIFTAVIIVTRLYWIRNSIPATGKVLSVDKVQTGRRSWRWQMYPTVEYPSRYGIITARGSANLPVNAGENIQIRYDPDNPEKFRLNTAWWLWYDIWAWYRLILFAIALYYLVLYITKRNKPGANEAYIPVSATGEETVLVYADEKLRPVAKVETDPRKAFIKRLVKATLFILLPVAIFFAGQYWNIPYATPIAIIIFFTYAALITSK